MDSLTDAGSLASDLAGPQPPVLLDVRWRLAGPPGIDSYRAGHLPGAQFVNLDRDLAAPPGPGGRHPLPAAADFQAAMRRAGVRAGRPVVLYDDGDSTAAARGWWLLRYFGHDQVRVLDGGYRAWLAAGQPAEQQTAAAGPGDFTARPGHLPLLDAAGAARLARDGLLLDARAAERYRGEVEQADPVAGHIPGAVSAPTAANVRPGWPFPGPGRAARPVRRAGRQHPVRPGSGKAGRGVGQAGRGSGRARRGVAGRGAVAGVYCGSGVTAAHEVLAMRLRRPAGRAVPGVVVGLDHRPGPAGGHRPRARLISRLRPAVR